MIKIAESLPRILAVAFLLLALAACVPAATPTNTPAPATPMASSSPEHSETRATGTERPTRQVPSPVSPMADTATPDPEAWMDLPVVPSMTHTARAIHRRGLEMGNNPQAFSKVGDCQNVLSMFLAIFDDPRRYRLGEYADLQDTIDYYSGSFSRQSLAVRGGFNAAAILSPFWADPDQCESGESPLACELRLNRPSLAIISLETWWEGAPENYERYYRQVVEYTISQGVVPILATKADNLEGDWAINQAIARVAREFDVPLWNFWAAVQPLPGHGLLEDSFHLTFDYNFFDEPVRMRAAWPWRNLTALQTLDTLRRGLADVSAGSVDETIP